MMTHRPQQVVFLPRRVCRQCLSARLRIHPIPRRHSSTDSTPPPTPNRSPLSQRTAEYIDTLQHRALAATQRLNDITGYTSIESLKTQIHTQGTSPLF
jgi:She9 / Mdm33 family